MVSKLKECNTVLFRRKIINLPKYNLSAFSSKARGRPVFIFKFFNSKNVIQAAKAISGKMFKLIFVVFILLVLKQMISHRKP